VLFFPTLFLYLRKLPDYFRQFTTGEVRRMRLLETVRKAPIGSIRSLRSRRNGSKRPHFAALGAENRGSGGRSRPFSDSFSRHLDE
jgi:hypothetical protein